MRKLLLATATAISMIVPANADGPFEKPITIHACIPKPIPRAEPDLDPTTYIEMIVDRRGFLVAHHTYSGKSIIRNEQYTITDQWISDDKISAYWVGFLKRDSVRHMGGKLEWNADFQGWHYVEQTFTNPKDEKTFKLVTDCWAKE